MARRWLQCAHPECTYLINCNPLFNGFCCKRCHWSLYTLSPHSHGFKCLRREDLSAPKANPIPPAEPLHGAAYVEPHTPPPPPIEESYDLLSGTLVAGGQEDEQPQEITEDEQATADQRYDHEAEGSWGHWHRQPLQGEAAEESEYHSEAPTEDRRQGVEQSDEQHIEAALEEQRRSSVQLNDDMIQVGCEIQIRSLSGPLVHFHMLTGLIIGFTDHGSYHVQLGNGYVVFAVAPEQCAMVSVGSEVHDVDDEPSASQAAGLHITLPTYANGFASSSRGWGAWDYTGVSAVGPAQQALSEGTKVQMKCVRGKDLAAINGQFAHIENVVGDCLYNLFLESGFRLLCVSQEYFDVVCDRTVDGAIGGAEEAANDDEADEASVPALTFDGTSVRQAPPPETMQRGRGMMQQPTTEVLPDVEDQPSSAAARPLYQVEELLRIRRCMQASRRFQEEQEPGIIRMLRLPGMQGRRGRRQRRGHHRETADRQAVSPAQQASEARAASSASASSSYDPAAARHCPMQWQ